MTRVPFDRLQIEMRIGANGLLEPVRLCTPPEHARGTEATRKVDGAQLDREILHAYSKCWSWAEVSRLFDLTAERCRQRAVRADAAIQAGRSSGPRKAKETMPRGDPGELVDPDEAAEIIASLGFAKPSRIRMQRWRSRGSGPVWFKARGKIYYLRSNLESLADPELTRLIRQHRALIREIDALVEEKRSLARAIRDRGRSIRLDSQTVGARARERVLLAEDRSRRERENLALHEYSKHWSWKKVGQVMETNSTTCRDLAVRADLRVTRNGYRSVTIFGPWGFARKLNTEKSA